MHHTLPDSGLVATKLMPPRTAVNLLRRPRLLQQMADHAAYPLMLVCAPAGFGKTTLVQHYLQDTGRPFAWLSLEAPDNGRWQGDRGVSG